MSKALIITLCLVTALYAIPALALGLGLSTGLSKQAPVSSAITGITNPNTNQVITNPNTGEGIQAP